MIAKSFFVTCLMALLVAAIHWTDVPAGNEDEWDAFIMQDHADVLTAAIQSEDELKLLLQSGAATALYAIAEPQRSKFIESLMFTDNGLSSFYTPALDGLSVTDASRILALFGWENYLASFLDQLLVVDVFDEQLAQEAAARECIPEFPLSGADDRVRACTPCVLPAHFCARRASCLFRTHYVCNICRC